MLENTPGLYQHGSQLIRGVLAVTTVRSAMLEILAGLLLLLPGPGLACSSSRPARKGELPHWTALHCVVQLVTRAGGRLGTTAASSAPAPPSPGSRPSRPASTPTSHTSPTSSRRSRITGRGQSNCFVQEVNSQIGELVGREIVWLGGEKVRSEYCSPRICLFTEGGRVAVA